MLKRHQVLPEDWLGDHLTAISKKYDISFSEAIRLVLSLQIPGLVSIAYPKIKTKSLQKELVSCIRKQARNKEVRGEFHILVSHIYFQARKSVESWEIEQKKLARKQKTKQ